MTWFLNRNKSELWSYVQSKQYLTADIHAKQTQVGGKKNSVILQKLTPDTAYSITVAAVYRTGEPKDISGQGKTSTYFFSLNTYPKCLYDLMGRFGIL